MTRNFKNVFLSLVGMGICLSSVVGAEEGKKKNWVNETEIGAVSTNGNSKASSFSGREKFIYSWTRFAMELTGAALKSESQGVTTAEKYNAGEKLTFSLSEKNYLYQKFLWDKDRFAGIRNRYDNSVGVGREIINNKKNLLNMEAGAGYVSEERVDAPTNNFSMARGFGKYVRKMSETSDFTQTAEYIQSLKFHDDFRVNTESSITAAINTYLSLKLAYIWKYVALPPPGFGKSDTTTTMGLVIKY
jgi:putative salt-induced outer membrane protein